MIRYLLALDTSGPRCSVALWRSHAPKAAGWSVGHDGAQGHAERLLPMVSELLDRAELTPADLNAVAFGQGPGAFTGLRVACGVAQGMSLALGVPLAAVGTHEAIADSLPRTADEQLAVVAQDARMGEVYVAAFVLPAGEDVLRAEAAITGGPSGHHLPELTTGGRLISTWTADSQASAPRLLEGPLLMAAVDLPVWLAQRLTEWRRQGLPEVGRLAGDAWSAYPDTLDLPPGWLMDAVLRPEAPHVARLGALSIAAGEGIDPALAQPLYVRDKVAFTTAERAGGQGGNPKAAYPGTRL